MNSVMQQHDQRTMIPHQQQDLSQVLQLQQQQQELSQETNQQQDGYQGLYFPGSTKQQQTVSPRFQMGQDSLVCGQGQQMNLNFQSNPLSFAPMESLGGLPQISEDRRKIVEADDNPNPAKKIRSEEPAQGLSLDLNVDESTAPAPVPASKEPISFFEENDVLSGRGGGTNVHPGNRNFRDLINMHRRAYLKARKNDKPAISRAIVRAIRETGGRFLKKNEKNGSWVEIGDDAAREKTSQALRQRAPEMRKLLFDTEREEARVVAEEHIRQQRMFVGNIGNMGNMAQNVGNMMGQGMNAVHGGNNMNGMNGLNNVNVTNNGVTDIPPNGMMNPALLQAMTANKNVLQNAQTNPELSQMFSAAILQGGINRFASNGA